MRVWGSQGGSRPEYRVAWRRRQIAQSQPGLSHVRGQRSFHSTLSVLKHIELTPHKLQHIAIKCQSGSANICNAKLIHLAYGAIDSPCYY